MCARLPGRSAKRSTTALRKGKTETNITAAAAIRVAALWRSSQSRTGPYPHVSARLSGLRSASTTRPLRQKPMSTGTTVIDRRAAAAMA